MSELLPCPFCGGEAEAVHEISGFWTVECIKCGALVDGVEAWNARAERTCHVECFDDGVDEGLDGEWFSYSPPTWYLSCGHESQGVECPHYCPNCGAKVVDNGLF